MIYWSASALQDLEQLYNYLLVKDIDSAELALDRIKSSTTLLAQFPLASRALNNHQTLRELLIPFGASGYVLLFRIKDRQALTILAVRHQKEQDYYQS